MTWNEYTACLSPLIKRFGFKAYDQRCIRDNFVHWKDKNQSELIRFVNDCIITQVPLPLKIPKVNHLRRVKDNEDPKEVITDDYLEGLLKKHDCSNLVELINKFKLT